jgi:hypothetical protein
MNIRNSSQAIIFFCLMLKQKVCGHKYKYNDIMETSETRLVITQDTYLISRGERKADPTL